MFLARPRPSPPLDIFGNARSLQVNHCRMPGCENYGIPARHMPSKRGPSPDRDMHYSLHGGREGHVPSLYCKSCKDRPPLRSNASIAAEVERLVDLGGLHTHEEVVGCRNPDCENHGRLKLPRKATLGSDAQVYTLKWMSRLDRRNVELNTYCTVDSNSRFVFGMHANFDPNFDPFIDVDSMSRAAFVDEVKRSDAHLFHVLFTKNLSVDKRRRIV